MADIKISEMTSASVIEESDNVEISQEVSSGVFATFKASILAIANKIASGINFTSALHTTNKTITGAINEIAQGGGGGAGHTILDDSGTALSQEDNLQFVGVYSEDDSVNEKTVVNIVREMTQAQYDLLSADEKKGIIHITDKNYVCEASEVKYSNSASVETELDSKEDWASNGILGAKNLNSYPYYHTSRPNFNGVDWVDVGDGTWTAQGTATGNSSVYCHNRTHPSDRELFLPNGDYRISGCPSGGGDSTYSINIDITTNGGNNNLARDYGEGATFTISGDDFSNKGAYVRISLTVFKNYAITGTLTFKPMVTLVEDTDTTWRPYAMTNKELTDVVNNVPLTAGTYTLQAVVDASGNKTYSWVASV